MIAELGALRRELTILHGTMQEMADRQAIHSASIERLTVQMMDSAVLANKLTDRVIELESRRGRPRKE